MDWGTFLAVLLGGAVTIAAQGVQTYWTNRGEVRRRSDQAAEDARSVVAELRAAAEGDGEGKASEELSASLRHDYLPKLRDATGYLARRSVREEMDEMIVWLERASVIYRGAGYSPHHARWLVLRRMDDVLSAYRRHDQRLPKQEPFEREFRGAIADYNEMMDRQTEYNSPQAIRARREAGEES